MEEVILIIDGRLAPTGLLGGAGMGLKWISRGRAGTALIGATLLCMAATGRCMAQTILPPPEILGPFASDPPVQSLADWQQRRAPLLREAFQSTVYGRLPTKRKLKFEHKKIIDPHAYGGLASLEEVTIRFDRPSTQIVVAYAVPLTAGAHPVVIAATFCGNRRALGSEKLATPSEPPAHCAQASSFAARADGKPDPFRAEFPVAMLLERGYAIATFWTGDIVRDDPAKAAETLRALTTAKDPDQRLGAIAAWGWGFSLIIDYLETDKRFDPSAEAIYGHSRNGKAAISAAAFDSRIDLVFAHQSGRGGASLSRSPNGESVSAITGRFPHWFAPNYGKFASDPTQLPIDQHELIGLIAPRPVLLGSGTEDQWADPEGAWQAARLATPVYKLFGHRGLTQNAKEEPDMTADIAYFLRPGKHITTTEDWEKLVAFMDAHFKKAQ